MCFFSAQETFVAKQCIVVLVVVPSIWAWFPRYENEKSSLETKLFAKKDPENGLFKILHLIYKRKM